MADKNAVFGVTCSYTGPGGTAVSAPAQAVTAPYQALSSGTLDIPDATAGATELPIPLGSIGTAVTAIMIRNSSGQELDIEFGGAAAMSFSLPTGGMFLYAVPSEPAETPITAVTVTTSAEQSGDGAVHYWAFGDMVGV